MTVVGLASRASHHGGEAAANPLLKILFVKTLREKSSAQFH